MAKPICVLHPWEALDLERNGITPTCCNHKHISKIEAMEMTARGDVVRQAASAKWVGPKMISVVLQSKWVPKQSGFDGPLVMQLV